MSPMAVLITTWDASSRLGVATMVVSRDATVARPFALPPEAATNTRSLPWVPKYVAPLLGEATVKTAEPNRTNASKNESPGSILPPVAAAVMDMAGKELPDGNQYINNMAKLI